MRLSKLVQIRKKGMLIAAAALTACALAACGGSGSSSDTKGGENTLSLIHIWITRSICQQAIGRLVGKSWFSCGKRTGKHANGISGYI